MNKFILRMKMLYQKVCFKADWLITLVMMPLIMVGTTSGTYADIAKVQSSFTALMEALYYGLRGLFAAFAALVILFHLFCIIAATDDQGVRRHFEPIKRDFIILIAIWFIPAIIKMIYDTVKDGGGAKFSDIKDLGGTKD